MSWFYSQCQYIFTLEESNCLCGRVGHMRKCNRCIQNAHSSTMHVGRSESDVFQTLLETAWLQHSVTGTRVAYATPLSDVIGCAEDDINRSVTTSRIHNFVRASTIRSSDGTILRWDRKVEHGSSCGTFHYFKSSHPTGADGRGDRIWAIVKVCAYRYTLTPVLHKLHAESVVLKECYVDVVPTRFLCSGKIQIMERHLGDVNTVGLVETQNQFVKFALWLAVTLLGITRMGAVYADVKPENFLLRSNRSGYYVGDVEVIRTCDVWTKHVSTYPISSNCTDVAASKALQNMVYGYVVTLFNLWYNTTDMCPARRGGRICRPILHSELPETTQYTFTNRDHPYFGLMGDMRSKRPEELRVIEDIAMHYCASTEVTWLDCTTRTATMYFFMDVADYLNAVLADAHEGDSVIYEDGVFEGDDDGSAMSQ
jgi:hypothetical protein